MQPADLVERCVAAINRSDPHLVLVIPRGKYPRRFPRGTLLCDNAEGNKVYSFDAVKMLAWLVAAGAAKLEPIAPSDSLRAAATGGEG